MRMNTTFLLSAMLCMSGISGQAQENSRLSFGVISDIHFGNYQSEGPMVKVPRALKHISAHGQLDALAVVGDLTNNGNPDEYDQLVKVFGDSQTFQNPVGEFLFMMGNHDNVHATGQTNYQEGLKQFNEGKPYPLHHYRVIKGYPFISLSMLSVGVNDIDYPPTAGTAYPTESVAWLEKNLERAAKECPGKPIFVFTHVAPRWTCYGTWTEYENGSAWCMKVLNPVLNKYPQAVVFAGHSHYPVGDPRSIHQGTNPQSERQNYYTVINTGSTTYTEIHPGAVEEGIHPPMFENVTEGLIVNELEGGNIEIRRIDTYRGQEIATSGRWVLEAPFDGSMFRYADVRDADDNPLGKTLRNGGAAPVFAEGATLSVVPEAYGVKVTIPQATDDECVFRYGVNVSLVGSGVLASNAYAFSQFYLNSDQPATVECLVPGLEPETEYTVEVVAYDSYDNPSTPITTTVITTEDTDPANVVPDPVERWTFDLADQILASEFSNVMLDPITVDYGTITPQNDAASAGITSVAGPSMDNLAAHIPATAALRVPLYMAEPSQNYTLQMDVRVSDASYPFNALFQADYHNSNDADCFFSVNTAGVAALGYGANIENNIWYRLLMINRDGEFNLYVNGKLINTASDPRWTITPEGFLLFADNDGERTDVEVSEVAFWNTAFTDGQIRRLGNIVEDEYINLITPSVRVVDDMEFAVTLNTNVSVTFEYPEWIEAVDVVPVAGTKSYLFRAHPLTAPGRRTGVIRVISGTLPVQEVEVTQVYMGEDLPMASGVWTFDDPNDLLACTGVSTLQGAYNTLDGVVLTPTLSEANIEPLEQGPTATNGAVCLQPQSYLQMTTNLGTTEPLSDYTLMFDIRPEKLEGFNALFRNTTDNTTDASIFICNGQVGLQANGLGYVGSLEHGVWHRVVAVVRGNYMHLYVDGKKVGESTEPNAARWALHPQSLFFADNDGEEVITDVAEIRFWDVPLSDVFVSKLGAVEQTQGPVDPLIAPNTVWTFDNEADVLAGTGDAYLKCAIKGEDGRPKETADLAGAGLVMAQGPTGENRAVTVPVDTYLRIYHNQDKPAQKNFSFLMDIRPHDLQGFKALFQSYEENTADGSLFVRNNQVGVNYNGLGYGGEMEEGKWHRVVFVVEACNIVVYLDGRRVCASSSPNVDKWSLYNGSLFFADDNAEEGLVDIAELRYWNDVLTPSMVKQLGGVGDGTGIGAVQQDVRPSKLGIYDLTGRRITGSQLRKGIYIIDGRKVIMR